MPEPKEPQGASGEERKEKEQERKEDEERKEQERKELEQKSFKSRKTAPEVPTEEQPEKKRGRPVTRVLPDPGSVEFTPGCGGCEGRHYQHSVYCRQRQAARELAAQEMLTKESISNH